MPSGREQELRPGQDMESCAYPHRSESIDGVRFEDGAREAMSKMSGRRLHAWERVVLADRPSVLVIRANAARPVWLACGGRAAPTTEAASKERHHENACQRGSVSSHRR